MNWLKCCFGKIAARYGCGWRRLIVAWAGNTLKMMLGVVKLNFKEKLARSQDRFQRAERMNARNFRNMFSGLKKPCTYEDSKYEGKGGSVRPSNVQRDMQNLHVAAYSATSSHRKQMKGEYMIDTSAIEILWAARRLAVVWLSCSVFVKLVSIMEMSV